MLEMKIAEESSKVRRTREKIEKQLQKEKKQVTPEALAQCVEKIAKWIAHNQPNREVIMKSSCQLFNQNQNAAEVSKKVQLFARSLMIHDTIYQK